MLGFGIYIGFVLLMGGLMYTQARSGRRETLLQAMREQKRVAMLELRTVQDSVVQLKLLELQLRRRVDAIEAEQDRLQRMAEARLGVSHETLVDALLADGVLSTDSLARLRAYASQTASGQALPDIAVMLGLLTPEALSAARRKYPGLE